jgi:hypothetical protein
MLPAKQVPQKTWKIAPNVYFEYIGCGTHASTFTTSRLAPSP